MRKTSTRPTSQQRWLLGWVACLLFMQSLLPVAGTWMQLRQAGTDWTEICTASGSRWVANASIAQDANAGELPVQGQSHEASGACWACVVGAQALAAPASQAMASLEIPYAGASPNPAPEAPRPYRVVGLAPPRGPPLLS